MHLPLSCSMPTRSNPLAWPMPSLSKCQAFDVCYPCNPSPESDTEHLFTCSDEQDHSLSLQENMNNRHESPVLFSLGPKAWDHLARAPEPTPKSLEFSLSSRPCLSHQRGRHTLIPSFLSPLTLCYLPLWESWLSFFPWEPELAGERPLQEQE